MSPLDAYPTFEEQRAFVYEYVSMPYGFKSKMLVRHGITIHQMRRWRLQVFADTIDRGLVPRSGTVSSEELAGMKRLLEENRALREEIAERDAAHEREIASREDELARQRRAVDALGKAIEILHASGASKNSEPAPDQPR